MVLRGPQVNETIALPPESRKNGKVEPESVTGPTYSNPVAHYPISRRVTLMSTYLFVEAVGECHCCCVIHETEAVQTSNAGRVEQGTTLYIRAETRNLKMGETTNESMQQTSRKTGPQLTDCSLISG